MRDAFQILPPRPRLTSRQRELFDRLVELCLEQGFAHLTIDDIASLLRCSKSTIYALAASREQLMRSAVVAFFRDAGRRVNARVENESDPLRRVEVYLRAVAEELAPASPAFMADIAAFAPAREVYEFNTRAAAQNIRELIADGVTSDAFRDVSASFIADVVASVMVRIQRGELSRNLGLSDSEAYLALADLVVHGVRARPAD
jgi:AcrR family transcriptional regulator